MFFLTILDMIMSVYSKNNSLRDSKASQAKPFSLVLVEAVMPQVGILGDFGPFPL